MSCEIGKILNVLDFVKIGFAAGEELVVADIFCFTASCGGAAGNEMTMRFVTGSAV